MDAQILVYYLVPLMHYVVYISLLRDMSTSISSEKNLLVFQRKVAIWQGLLFCKLFFVVLFTVSQQFVITSFKKCSLNLTSLQPKVTYVI